MAELHEQIKRGHVETMKSLIGGGANLEEADSDGIRPLHLSCLANSVECTLALLDAGANVNAVDAGDYTPLHGISLALGNSDGVARQIHALVDAGADLEARLNPCEIEGQERDWTPLMLASAEGGLTAVQTLIDAGANVNASDLLGETPLMLAASQSSQPVQKIRALIGAGADVSTQSNDGRTARDHAAEFIRLLFGGEDPSAREKVGSLLDDLGNDVELDQSSMAARLDRDLNFYDESLIRSWPLVIALLTSP